MHRLRKALHSVSYAGTFDGSAPRYSKSGDHAASVHRRGRLSDPQRCCPPSIREPGAVSAYAVTAFFKGGSPSSQRGAWKVDRIVLATGFFMSLGGSQEAALR